MTRITRLCSRRASVFAKLRRDRPAWRARMGRGKKGREVEGKSFQVGV